MPGFKITTLLEVFIGPMTIYSLPFLCCKWISSRYSGYTKKVIHEKKKKWKSITTFHYIINKSNRMWYKTWWLLSQKLQKYFFRQSVTIGKNLHLLKWIYENIINWTMFIWEISHQAIFFFLFKCHIFCYPFSATHEIRNSNITYDQFRGPLLWLRMTYAIK